MRKLIIKFCNFIFGKQFNGSLPRVWILIFDMVIVIASYLMAMVLLFFNDMKNPYWDYDWSRIIIVPCVYLVMFLIFKTHDGLIRYSGFNDIRKIIIANSFALSILVFSKMIFMKINTTVAYALYPRFFIIIYHYFITLVIMILSRLIIRRIYNEFYKKTSSGVMVLCISAEVSAEIKVSIT